MGLIEKTLRGRSRKLLAIVREHRPPEQNRHTVQTNCFCLGTVAQQRSNPGSPERKIMSLHGKTLFISGGSRGIGLAIALRAARDGANVAIAAKTRNRTPRCRAPSTPRRPRSRPPRPGLAAAVRHPRRDQIDAAVARTVERFGGIDICINNASAIHLTGTPQTEPKRYDLMQGINARGTFLVSRACIPHLMKAANPHVLNRRRRSNSTRNGSRPTPPMRWPVFDEPLRHGHGGRVPARAHRLQHTLAQDLHRHRRRAPHRGHAGTAVSRTPEIMADAAWHILTQPSTAFTGLSTAWTRTCWWRPARDLRPYRCEPGSTPLAFDLFVQPGHHPQAVV
jgi:citronellol/citronellal dehydrogenase